MRLAFISVLPVLFVATACANSGANYQPVIDGAVGPNYSADLAACQNLAATQPALGGSAGTNVAAGAGAAALGAAIVDNTGNNVRDAAAVGAIAGLAGSAVQAQADKETIIKNCMRNRGYNVVG